MREEYRRKVTSTTRTSSSYGASGTRSAFGYWIPLALTVTAATVALGAWIWSERSEEEDASESEAEQYYASGAQQGRSGSANVAAAAGAAGLGAAAGYAGMSGGPPPGPGPLGTQSGPRYGSDIPGPPAQGGFIGGPAPTGPPGPPLRGEAEAYYRDTSSYQAQSTNVTTQTSQQDQTFFGRMSNALGMNRSGPPGGPTSGDAGAGWAVAATGALAAAGEMVGKAVSQVRGSQDDAHSSDQEKWAEEADKPERTQSSLSATGVAAAAGAASLAAGGRVSRSGSKSPGQMGIARQGTAQEFYSGSVDIPRRSSVQAKKRRTVAVVVSSVDKPGDSLSVDAHHSMLAEIPQHLHPDTTKVVVLIYAPDLSVHPLSSVSRRAFERRASASAQSNTSSYQHIHTPGSNLGTEPLNTPLQTPGDFPQDAVNSNSDDQGILAHVDPKPMDSNTSLPRRGSHMNDDSGPSNPLDEQTTALFKSLYNQASAIVDRDTSILPYTSHNGHKHILKSVQPEIVYVQESLCGNSGEVVAELHGWVRQVVVVIGDEGGMGGLVDSDVEIESEEERRDSSDGGKRMTGEGEKWWKREEVSGVGRGVSVVEGLRVGEDWERRVNEAE